MSMLSFLKSRKNTSEDFLSTLESLNKKGRAALEQEHINTCAQISAHLKELQVFYQDNDINWANENHESSRLLAKVITLGIKEVILSDWLEKGHIESYHGYLYFYDLAKFCPDGKLYVSLSTEKWLYEEVRKQLNLDSDRIKLNLGDNYSFGMPTEKVEFCGLSIRF